MTERDYTMKSTYKGFITIHDESRGLARHIGYSNGRVVIQTHSRQILYRYLNSLVPQDYDTTVQDRILDNRYVIPLYTEQDEDTTK